MGKRVVWFIGILLVGILLSQSLVSAASCYYGSGSRRILRDCRSYDMGGYSYQQENDKFPEKFEDILHFKPISQNEQSALYPYLTSQDNWVGLTNINKIHALTGDFNGDGRFDLAVYLIAYPAGCIIHYDENSENNVDYVTDATGKQWAPEIGCDGTVYKWVVYQDYIDNRGAIPKVIEHGFPSGIPLVGDYNGDRRDDLIIYDANTGGWYIYNVNFPETPWIFRSGIEGKIFLGAPGILPVPGDYDGDGVFDLAVYDATNYYWWIRKLNGGFITSGRYDGFQFGSPNDVPVPGDYDGDGAYDLALYNTVTGNWHIYSVKKGQAIIWPKQFGGLESIPVPGDYDGDGVFDLAIIYEPTSDWYIYSIPKDRRILEAYSFGLDSNKDSILLSGDFDYTYTPPLPEARASWASLSTGNEITTAEAGDTVLMTIGGEAFEDEIKFRIRKEGTFLFSLFRWWNDMTEIGGNRIEPFTINNGSGTYSFIAQEVGTTNQNISGELEVSSSSNDQPSTRIIALEGNNSETFNVFHTSVNSPINFQHESNDDDDLLNITWNFGDGNTSNFPDYSNFLTPNSGNVIYEYLQGGRYYNVILTAKEMTRNQIVQDDKRIYIFKEGINVVPTIRSPSDVSSFGNFVVFNASRSFVANCSLGPRADVAFTSGLLNCSYIHAPNTTAQNLTGYELKFEWILDASEDLTRTGTWSLDHSQVVEFLYFFPDAGQRKSTLKLTYIPN